MKDWKSLEDAFTDESETRLNTNINDLCIYGIKPLDDSLVCIAPNELVVIGSDSGYGKSEMAINIARTNIKRGKRVALYYLEGGYKEAISRMKWRDIADEYFKNYSHLGIELDYRKWMLNLLQNETLRKIESKIWERYKAEYKNNLFLYSAKQLNADTFMSSLLEFHKLVPVKDGSPFIMGGKMDVDLVIIDHLQYFSLTKAENEIFEITEILRKVKNITDNLNTPVVLISHLRKKTRDRGLPGQEDFYGSSNIPKIASTAITLTPSSEKDNLQKGIYPTYIRVVKSRIGVRPNYAFLVDFYLDRREYADEYVIYRLDNFGNVASEPTEKPRWTGK